MNQPDINFQQLKDIIVDVANKELLPRLANVSYSNKSDNSIVTEADIAAQESIIKQLKKYWPAIPLLGEEMSPEEQNQILQSKQAVWCLDPLDGTSNFATGIPYFAISLALLFNGKCILGVVYDPSRNEYFQAQDITGQLSASLNSKTLKLSSHQSVLSHAMAIIDLKRLPKNTAARVASEPPYASQRNFGASALDWCWLAASRAQVYLHGNQNIWDYAAGELIFRAAGGFSITLAGEAVFKQALEKRSVVAATGKALFTEWTQWLSIN